MAVSNVNLSSVANELRHVAQELSSLTNANSSTSPQSLADPSNQNLLNTYQSLSNTLNEALQKGDSQATNTAEQAMQAIIGLQGNHPLGLSQNNSPSLAQDEQFLGKLLQSGNADPALVKAMEDKISQELGSGGNQGVGSQNPLTSQLSHPDPYTMMFANLAMREAQIGSDSSNDGSSSA